MPELTGLPEKERNELLEYFRQTNKEIENAINRIEKGLNLNGNEEKR